MSKRERTSTASKKARPRRRGPLDDEAKKSAALKREKKLVCVICHFKKEAVSSPREVTPDLQGVFSILLSNAVDMIVHD